jgi:hypothetical protein
LTGSRPPPKNTHASEAPNPGEIISLSRATSSRNAQATSSESAIKLLIRAHQFNTTLVDGDSMPFAALAKRGV